MFVMCKECFSKHDSAKVTFVDISEGDRGQDVLTFICPKTGQEASSNVYRGDFYDTMVLLEYGTPEHTAWLKDNSCNGTFVQHFGTKWVGPYVPAEKAEKYKKLTASDLYELPVISGNMS